MTLFRPFARACILFAGLAVSGSVLAQSSATPALVGQWHFQTATGTTTTNGESVDFISKGVMHITQNPTGLSAAISWLDERGQITKTRKVDGSYSNGTALFTHPGTRTRSGRNGKDISTEVKIHWTLQAKGELLSGQRLVDTDGEVPKPVTGSRANGLATQLAAAPASTPERGPSTPAERARVVQMALDAEQNPQQVQARDGAWLATWVNDVPDLTFTNSALARWLSATVKGELREPIKFQYTASAMAFQIKNPEQEQPQPAIDLAGMEGVLRAYEALVRTNANHRSVKLDLALKARTQGELPAFVQSVSGRDAE